MPPLLVLLVLLLFTTPDAYPDACSNDTCGGQTIVYPFWNVYSSGSRCGYPGLGLACRNDTTLALDVLFPEYRVLGIDYATHTISLTDVAASESSCPRLQLNLTVDPMSWLQMAPSSSNLTVLYNCKSNVSLPSAVKLSRCSPGHNTSSYVILDEELVMGDGCESAVVAPVLDAHKKVMARARRGSPNASLADVLKGGFEMRYSVNSEQCGACEMSEGWCRYGRVGLHGETDFTCLCDDGENEHRCGMCALDLYLVPSKSWIYRWHG